MRDGAFARKYTTCHKDSQITMLLSYLRQAMCFRKQLQFQKAMTAVTKYQDAAVSATAPQPKALSGR